MLTKEGARQCQAAASGDTEAPRALPPPVGEIQLLGSVMALPGRKRAELGDLQASTS